MKSFVCCALALAAGCGDGDVVMDMAVSDLSQPGDLLPADAGFLAHCPAPTTIDTAIQVTGVARDLAGMPMAGVVVSFYKAADDSLIGNATYTSDAGTSTGADGAFEITGTGDSKPFLAYFQFSGPNLPPIRLYLPITSPAFGLSSDLANNDQLAVGYTAAGVTQNAAKGFVVASLSHCNGKRIAGATGSFTPAADIVDYDQGKMPVPMPGLPGTSTLGNMYGFNVPAGPATATFTLGAQEIVSPTFTVLPGSVVIVAVMP